MKEQKYINADLEQAVLKLIRDSGIDIEREFVEEPQAIFIPKDKNRSAFFVLISLFFNEKSSALENIEPLVLKVAQVVANSPLISCSHGLEILPCILNGQETQRIFRLSIAGDSLDRIGNIGSKGLLLEKPVEGITCGWYLKQESEPNAPTS